MLAINSSADNPDKYTEDITNVGDRTSDCVVAEKAACEVFV